MTNTKPLLSDVALLLVGHGSSRLDSARHATDRLAEALRDSGDFAEVAVCFLKQAPAPSLDLVRAQRVVVIPNFAGEGGFTRTIIPDLLGLSGPISQIGGRTIHYTAPLGAHPGVPALLAERALDLCRRQNITPGQASLLLIGHGSSRPGASATTETIAAAIAAQTPFGQVAAGFLEQSPFARDWPALTRHDDVIALPLLVSDGAHGTADVPALFAPPLPLGKRAHLLDGPPLNPAQWAGLARELALAALSVVALPDATPSSCDDRTPHR